MASTLLALATLVYPLLVLASGPVPADFAAPIHPNGDQSKCLAYQLGIDPKKGSPVELVDCNGGGEQKWIIYKDTGKVQSLLGNWCLDAGVPPFNNNQPLKTWECVDVPAQKWNYENNRLYLNTDGNQKCMDLTGGSKDNFTPIQIYDCAKDGDYNPNQIWTMDSDNGGNGGNSGGNSGNNGGSGDQSSGSVAIHPNGDEGKCMTIEGTFDGAKVEIHDCDGSDVQQWFLTKQATYVRNKGGNFCLDAGLTPFGDGHPMRVFPCIENLPAQHWFYTDDNHIAVENDEHHQCLDLTDGRKDNGNALQSWTCDGNNDKQVWTTTASAYNPNGNYGSSGPNGTIGNAVNAVSSAATDSSSDSSSSMSKFGPIALGLLAANFVATLALCIIGVMLYVRNRRGGAMSRSIPSNYGPVAERDVNLSREIPTFKYED